MILVFFRSSRHDLIILAQQVTFLGAPIAHFFLNSSSLPPNTEHFFDCINYITCSFHEYLRVNLLRTMSNDDYYYYRNKGFEDYIPTTTDPGPWMLIAVSIYSICCLIAIPVVVQLIGVCRWTNDKQLSSDSEDGVKSDDNISQNCSSDRDNVQINMDASDVDARRREEEANKEGIDDDKTQKINSSQQSKTDTPSSPTLRYFLEKTKSVFNPDANSIPTDSPVASYLDELERKKKKLDSIRIKYNPNPQTINVDQENSKEKQKSNSYKQEKRSRFGKRFIEIIQYDQETNRILILGIPFVVSAVAVALFDAVTLALVSKYLGVEALSAFIVTNVLLGLTDTFIKGVADALNTVCSHAIGADNNFLAGQYTQIALMIYVIGSVPLCVCWWFLMDDAIRLFGMNERVVEIGAQYTKVVMFDYMAVGMFDTFTALLDVSGYALPATIMDLVAASLDLLSVWLLLMFVEGMDLFWVGMAQMVSSVVIYAVFVCFVVCKGWIDPFKSGLVHSFGLKNIPAVKYVLKTAIPLSIGTLLEYGEWEALTFFAAVLGPTEGKHMLYILDIVHYVLMYWLMSGQLLISPRIVLCLYINHLIIDAVMFLHSRDVGHIGSYLGLI